MYFDALSSSWYARMTGGAATSSLPDPPSTQTVGDRRAVAISALEAGVTSWSPHAVSLLLGPQKRPLIRDVKECAFVQRCVKRVNDLRLKYTPALPARAAVRCNNKPLKINTPWSNSFDHDDIVYSL